MDRELYSVGGSSGTLPSAVPLPAPKRKSQPAPPSALMSWWEGLREEEKNIFRSAVKSNALFFAFITVAYFLHNMPKWDDGGSMITYAVIFFALLAEGAHRAARRYIRTAWALRKRGKSASPAQVLDVIRQQTRADVKEFWRTERRSVGRWALAVVAFVMVVLVLQASDGSAFFGLAIAFAAMAAAFWASREEAVALDDAGGWSIVAVLRSIVGAACLFFGFVCIALLMPEDAG